VLLGQADQRTLEAVPPGSEQPALNKHDDVSGDAARWWRAYQLAERDQVDELRRLAAAGDDHARRQLASWLADRGTAARVADRARLGEAIALIRPLADAGDDVSELWLARWLADTDRLGELRLRADSGSYHAGRLLARCLARHDLLDELRERADAGSYHAWREMIRRLAERDMHEELRELAEAAYDDQRQLIFDAVGGSAPGDQTLRVLAELGHKASRRHLARRLAREGRIDELRQRAEAGDEYARHMLDEPLNEQ
jgi:hypothetical protein